MKIGNSTRIVKLVISRLEHRLSTEMAEGLTLSHHQTYDGDVAEIEMPNIIKIQISQFANTDHAEMVVTTDREVFNKMFRDVDKAAALIIKKISLAINAKPAIQTQAELPLPPVRQEKLDGAKLTALDRVFANLLNKSKENK